MTDKPAWTDLGLTYEQALHGMQTAVAYEMAIATEIKARHPQTEAKHLRVGVNSAMAEHGALVWLLVEKGIITPDEYHEAMRLAINQELAMYEAQGNSNGRRS